MFIIYTNYKVIYTNYKVLNSCTFQRSFLLVFIRTNFMMVLFVGSEMKARNGVYFYRHHDYYYFVS